MMGPGIALTLASGGVRSTILSRTEEGAQRGLESARSLARVLENNGLWEPDRAADAISRVEASAQFDQIIAAVDLVIESAPEDMELKQKMFGHMDSIARPEAVLASNTSGLSITAIASRCKRPERVLTTHFWNPPHLMPLVEVVKGDNTTLEITESVRDLRAACGKIPVVVKKDRRGQLGNRLQMALVREAVNIVAEGIAGVDEVDIAVRNGFGLRLPMYGIFEHQDIVGLDLGLKVVDYVAADLYNEPKAPDLYREKLARGETGAKAGKGFYDWSQKSAEEVKARRDRFVIEMLRYQRAQKDAAASSQS
jgi:3-hydroxybutyryl-CoA dehydrogenase